MSDDHHLKLADLRRMMDALPREPGECTYPIYIPAGLYDRAVLEGYNMRDYAKMEPIPEYSKFGPSSAERWLDCPGLTRKRKHISDRNCGENLCQPGLSGKCTACADDN